MDELQREKIVLEIRKLDAEILKMQRDMKYEGWRILLTSITVAIGVFAFCFAVLRWMYDPLLRAAQ